MAKVRKDKRGRNLHKGEYLRPDGRYALCVQIQWKTGCLSMIRISPA